MGELDGLFDPRSVALVGASSDPHGISGRPLRLLIEHGYPGALYPVNPRHRELMRREVFPRIADVLGAGVDPDFGPVVLCGLGGLYVEQLGDVALRLVPVSADEARAMVGELRGARLFERARGRPPGDVDALVGAIVRFSALAAALPREVAAIEINPLAVGPRGLGVVMLDAAMEMCDEP